LVITGDFRRAHVVRDAGSARFIDSSPDAGTPSLFGELEEARLDLCQGTGGMKP
jgi:hypothetical protein